MCLPLSYSFICQPQPGDFCSFALYKIKAPGQMPRRLPVCNYTVSLRLYSTTVKPSIAVIAIRPNSTTL